MKAYSEAKYLLFLRFRTDRSGQTVQTQIRLLRVYTVCYYVYIFWTHFSMVKPCCSNFGMITTIFSVSEFLGFLRYFVYLAIWMLLKQNNISCLFALGTLSLEDFMMATCKQSILNTSKFIYYASKFRQEIQSQISWFEFVHIWQKCSSVSIRCLLVLNMIVYVCMYMFCSGYNRITVYWILRHTEKSKIRGVSITIIC